MPAWPGPCPQSSQISLWLISTLQKSSLAFLQRNEATDCGNQSLIVCACARKHGRLRVPVRAGCLRAVCGPMASSPPPANCSRAILEQRSGSFLFPLGFLFFHERLSFSWKPGARPPLIMLPRGFHRDGARPPESPAVRSAECSIDRQQEPECWRAPSDSPSRQRLQGKP